MRIIQYLKTRRGALVVSDVEKKTEAPQTNIEKYAAFFEDFIREGRNWEIHSVDEIVVIFRAAAHDIHEKYQQLHDATVAQHAAHCDMVAWWLGMNGYKPQEVPSLESILDAMEKRCEAFSCWVKGIQYRPFYAGSDISQFISKPLKVAAKLK